MKAPASIGPSTLNTIVHCIDNTLFILGHYWSLYCCWFCALNLCSDGRVITMCIHGEYLKQSLAGRGT